MLYDDALLLIPGVLFNIVHSFIWQVSLLFEFKMITTLLWRNKHKKKVRGLNQAGLIISKAFMCIENEAEESESENEDEDED